MGCVKCGTGLSYRDHFTKTKTAEAPWGAWLKDDEQQPWCEHCQDDWDHLSRLFYTELNLCGCGNPEAAYDLIRGLLVLADAEWETRREMRPFFGDSPASDGAYHIVISALDSAGLTSHGTSISTPWITEKGKHYLKLMEKHTFSDWDQDSGLPHDGNPCPDGCRHKKREY